MNRLLYNPKMLVFELFLNLFACDDHEKPSLRTKIDYSTLTAETPYSQLFVDANGATTVDQTSGNQRHKMFQALNSVVFVYFGQYSDRRYEAEKYVL